MANRRRQEDGDEAVDDGKPRGSKRPKEPVAKNKKAMEEIPAAVPYIHHDEDEEGSVTRCVCGSGESRQYLLQYSLIVADEEDFGNFMIQCEQCSVWQHGVCMGVANVDESPEHYYCEMCRPENHAGLLRYASCDTYVFHSAHHPQRPQEAQVRKARIALGRHTRFPPRSLCFPH
jgi:hypothetical protein